MSTIATALGAIAWQSSSVAYGYPVASVAALASTVVSFLVLRFAVGKRRKALPYRFVGAAALVAVSVASVGVGFTALNARLGGTGVPGYPGAAPVAAPHLSRNISAPTRATSAPIATSITAATAIKVFKALSSLENTKLGQISASLRIWTAQANIVLGEVNELAGPLGQPYQDLPDVKPPDPPPGDPPVRGFASMTPTDRRAVDAAWTQLQSKVQLYDRYTYSRNQMRNATHALESQRDQLMQEAAAKGIALPHAHSHGIFISYSMLKWILSFFGFSTVVLIFQWFRKRKKKTETPKFNEPKVA